MYKQASFSMYANRSQAQYPMVPKIFRPASNNSCASDEENKEVNKRQVENLQHRFKEDEPLERLQVDGGECSQAAQVEPNLDHNGSQNGCNQRSDGQSSKKEKYRERDRDYHGLVEQRTQVIELCDHFEFYSDNEVQADNGDSGEK